MAKIIRIDLDKIHEAALVGIHRAYVFLGFELNAANSPQLKSFDLPGGFDIKMFPDDISDEMLAAYKREFSTW